LKKYIFDKEGKGFIFEVEERHTKGVPGRQSRILYKIKSIVSFPNKKHYRFKVINGALHCKFKNPNPIRRFITDRRKWTNMDFIDIQKKYIKKNI
jgi:ribosomal protein S18